MNGAIALERAFGTSGNSDRPHNVVVGPSAPELVTSIIAAIRKQTGVAFDNIGGSNTYPVLCIGGVTAARGLANEET